MGRVLVLADIHANLRALEAVLRDGARRSFDYLWVLGDVVGYGPEPEECVERVAECASTCVAGNHDMAAVGAVELERFNPDAAAACLWTRDRLSPSAVRYLSGLPLRAEESPFTLVHGSPRDPLWEYVVSPATALTLASHCRGTHCLVGHTHCQNVFGLAGSAEIRSVRVDGGIRVSLTERLLLNPRAVGQPRDGDPRAAYAVYDDDDGTMTFHRVEYDVAGVCAAVLRTGLPDTLALRLHAGR